MLPSINEDVADGEYYTIPSIETISDSESISNFLIGRRGYGSIKFNAPIDLIGISTLSLLREIVIFDKAYVAVYPHAFDAPKIGIGINVPAQVCLENVHPDGIEMDQFIAKLREKADTEFVSYDMEMGIWTFNVNHFSTYDGYSVDHSTVYSGVQRIRHREISTSPETSRGPSPHQNPPSVRSSSTSTSPSASSSMQQSADLGQGGHQSLQSSSSFVHETTSVPTDEQYSLHQLRSSTQYYHEEQYIPRPRKLLKAFNDAYIPFSEGKSIPADARKRLEEFLLDSDQFHRLITARELPKSRYIYLDEGRIKFDEWTKPPHAEVIFEVAGQIYMQDQPFRLFNGGTGGDVHLVAGSDKQPDGHWTVNTNRLPNPQQGLNVFPVNAATGKLAPQLILEVAVSNESMPTLDERDLAKYFAPGTGTRAWIGIKIFKSNSANGTHRWWAGWARRKMINGQFVDQPDLSQESMPRVNSNNIPITQLTNLIFHIDIFTLLHPCQAPANYPATIDINLEDVRQMILQNI